jgi:hypothetical protein
MSRRRDSDHAAASGFVTPQPAGVSLGNSLESATQRVSISDPHGFAARGQAIVAHRPAPISIPRVASQNPPQKVGDVKSGGKIVPLAIVNDYARRLLRRRNYRQRHTASRENPKGSHGQFERSV